MYNEVSIILLLILLILVIYIYQISTIKKYGGLSNIFQDNIYLDNNGTTLICSESLNSYIQGTSLGNASSFYAHDAQNLIDNNNNLIQKWIRSNNSQIIYTSGASESNNTILKLLSKSQFPSWQTTNIPHFILSSYEHNSSLDCAKILEKDGKIQLSLIVPDMFGFINPNELQNYIQPNTVLISIMHINNELGTINDIQKIGIIIKNINPNIIFHVDAVQSFGKIPIPMNDWKIDALSVSYHKFYGPQGIGLLIINNKLLINKLKKYPLISGTQNNGLRGGTSNISGIAGAYRALIKNIENREIKNQNLYQMKKYIVNFLESNYNIGNYINYYNQSNSYSPTNPCQKNEIVFLGNYPLNASMSPNTILLSIIKYGSINNHFCNIKLRDDLKNRNIIISIGSACHSNSKSASHVLNSIKAPFVIKCGVIRISMGDDNNMDEIKIFCEKLKECINLQN